MPTDPFGDPATTTVFGKTVAMACRLGQLDSHGGQVGSHEFSRVFFFFAEMTEPSLPGPTGDT